MNVQFVQAEHPWAEECTTDTCLSATCDIRWRLRICLPPKPLTFATDVHKLVLTSRKTVALTFTPTAALL